MLSRTTRLATPDAIEGQTHEVPCWECTDETACAACESTGVILALVDAFNCLCDDCSNAYWLDRGDGQPKLRFAHLGDAFNGGYGLVTKRTSRHSRMHGPVCT